MKILHTVQMYHPHVGGSEEVVRQISERLAVRGHDVTVATGHHPDRHWSVLNGVRVRQFKIKGNAGLGMTGEIDEYRSFIRSADVDVMLNYAAQIWSTDLTFDLLGALPFTKVLVPCGYTFGVPHLERYHQELPSHLQKYDALVYMSSTYQDKKFGDHHGLGNRAVIIPNGADEAEFDGLPSTFRDRFKIRTPKMILTVSNHYALKGHRHLIESFRGLSRDDTTLVIIGKPLDHPWSGCYPSCRWAAATHRRIKVLSQLDRKDVVEAYKAADLFVLASNVECAPLVIYEAMAASVPFVSLDVGNVRDHSAFGEIVTTSDELGPAINRVLDSEDAKERGRLARMEWLRHHTWGTITDAYEALYARLIDL